MSQLIARNRRLPLHSSGGTILRHVPRKGQIFAPPKYRCADGMGGQLDQRRAWFPDDEEPALPSGNPMPILYMDSDGGSVWIGATVISDNRFSRDSYWELVGVCGNQQKSTKDHGHLDRLRLCPRQNS